MSTFLRFPLVLGCGGVLVAVFLVCGSQDVAAQAAPVAALPKALPGGASTTSKLGLIVGCTTYENPNIQALQGPRNDVPMVARLLIERFSFNQENIRKLYDGPGAFGRPTYANIVAGFEHLISQATPGSQIVISLSGHGTQTPIPKSQTDPLDPKNPEPDGLDEVFLPADATSWSNDEVGNAIRDNQVGDWLDALKRKGAHVFIIFDCCHSGTMTRGIPAGPADEPQEESQRAVDPVDLGIPETLLLPPKLAGEAAQRNRGASRVEESTLELNTVPASGSVVAFYAAQSFETAPDLPRPATAARVAENFYGMLTYTLSQTLLQQKSRTTYRDLSRAVVSHYRAERGSRGPTPLFAGDLDREVLGLSQWPAPSPINLERKEGRLRLSGGEVLGVTDGSILAVLKPGADPTVDPAVLGYVCAKQSTATSAAAEPCSFNNVKAADPATFPDFAPCKIVSQNIGDMRIKLRIRPAAADLQKASQTLQAALADLPPETRALVDLQTAELPTNATKPDFELRLVSAASAKNDFQLAGAGPRLLLLEADQAAQPGGRVRVSYDVLDAKALSIDLERDLQKIYKWRNLWRVIGKLGPQLAGEAGDLKFEIAAIASEDDRSGGTLLKKSFLADGQAFEVRLSNQGLKDYWVTLLFLSTSYGIDIWYSDAIRRGDAFPPLRSTIDGTSFGPEGFVVLAIPMRAEKLQPSFAVLEQTPLGTANRALPPGAGATPQTPFGNILATAAGAAGTRDVSLDEPTNPTIVSWSWVTLPKGRSGK